MWTFSFLEALLVACVAISQVLATASVTETFRNSEQWQLDTNGNQVDLTSAKIDFLAGTYVWYGLPKGCGDVWCGITSYSSTDLKTWHFNGFMFDPYTTEILALCGATSSGNCGRPHIVYSAENDDYVLWVNSNAPGYPILISSTPTSGYVLSESRALLGYQPAGPFQAGDFSVEVINGTGYIVYSLIDFSTVGASIWPPFLQSMYLQQLTPDMRNTTGNVSHVISQAGDLVDYEAESPDIFKRGDWYYVVASNTCGFCTGTLLIVYRSKSLAGPWLRQIISADTCGGQSDGVLVLPSPSGGPTAYMHVADLIAIAPLTGTREAAHGHQIQELVFNPDGSLQDYDCSLDKSVRVTFTPGKNVSSSGLAVNATDGSGELATYNPVCNLPTYQLYQTWASSESGHLAEVGVNIAGDYPSGNTTITVFRYTNNTNFFTPRFVWDTLSTFTLVPGDVSQSLAVVRVPVNATVSKGDRLGMAIVTTSDTPLCTFVETSDCDFDVETSTRTLFAIGANQVSYRGKNGTTPPVVVLAGQQLKWYAIVK